MKKNYRFALELILIIAAAAVLTVFEALNISYTGDTARDALINGIIPRAAAGAALAAVYVLFGGKLSFELKRLPFALLFCVPCFLVVLANFPFTALISGRASVTRPELIWLFILECLAIGLLEEFLFRGVIQDAVKLLLENKPHREIFTVLITSALFGIIHLFNLFAGAGAGATFLQVGYSFLIGCMLSAVMLKTKNIWLCVIIHALFDVGGNLIPRIGTGLFQDTCFWIFTAVAGVICFVHILYRLLKDDKRSEK